MKKIIAMVALVFSCMLAYAQTNGEVIVMNKAMFIKDVFDYENWPKSMPIKSLSTKSMWIRKRNWQRCSMQQASLFLYSSL